MDDSADKSTLTVSDFNIGDLIGVPIDWLLESETTCSSDPSYLYGIVIKDPRAESRIEMFTPQIAIYMLSSKLIEFHWPSYLTIISSIYRKG